MSQLLNYKIEGEGHTTILIHGLFGNLDNLGLLARDLRQDHQVVSVDLRNHGLSFQSDEHNYELMAQDVYQLIQSLELEQYSVIGHSMGGKVAMEIALNDPGEALLQLIVVDIAPKRYEPHHQDVFTALNSVDLPTFGMPTIPILKPMAHLHLVFAAFYGAAGRFASKRRHLRQTATSSGLPMVVAIPTQHRTLTARCVRRGGSL